MSGGRTPYVVCQFFISHHYGVLLANVAVSWNLVVCVMYDVQKMLHTQHNRFTALLEFVRDHPGEQVPER